MVMIQRALWIALAGVAVVGCGEVKPVAAPVTSQQTAPVARKTIATGIKWGNSLEKAVAEAKKSDKVIMIDFYTDWCTFCKKMDVEAYIDKEVVDLSAKTIPIKIDAERQMAVSRRFGVDRFPMVLFVDKNLTVVGRIDGYMKPAEFAKEMIAVL